MRDATSYYRTLREHDNDNGRNRKDQITKRRKQATWLAAYEAEGSVDRACQHANVSKITVNGWRTQAKGDDAFRTCYQQARDAFADRLEAEALRRSLEGEERGIWHQGVRVGVETRYDNVLLMKVLAALKPDTYGDKTKDLTLADAAQAKITADIAKALADPEIRSILYTLDDAMRNRGLTRPMTEIPIDIKEIGA